ncbi:hypothetical protein GCM10011505_44170 [Tistrella bauzanensis]|uniref:Glyoxalase n=1 Tax=Tistrella bauzanensis TaxID=657419 RepID=A0ABQ1J5I4_9PROT|nr:hypothetical protein GCM10011505_44170 [Tistrella bauzanensis]
MKIESCYPVIMTDRVAETAAFWQTHLGFDVVFQADWYVHLIPSPMDGHPCAHDRMPMDMMSHG